MDPTASPRHEHPRPHADEGQDIRRAITCLLWTLVIAYSLAPFDFQSDYRWEQVWRFDAQAQRQKAVDLAVHAFAFGAAAAIQAIVGRRVRLSRAVVAGVLTCAAIEIGQAFLPSRHANVVDWVVNSSAFVVAYRAAQLFRHPARIESLWDSKTPRLSLLGAWTIFWTVCLLLPLRLVNLTEWDAGYPLVIGAEPSGELAWTGHVAFAAIYGRALAPAEVRAAFDSGPSASGADSGRFSRELLAAFDLRAPQPSLATPNAEARRELTLRQIQPPSVTETASTGTSPRWGVFASSEAASSLTTAIARRGSFSVELWVRPATDRRATRGTIIAVSTSVWRRNFSIGQEGTRLTFRVRNRLNGLNGERFETLMPWAQTEELIQIVATYDRGLSSVFTNGVLAADRVDLRAPSALLGLGTTTASQAVSAFIAALMLSVAAPRRPRERGAFAVARLTLIGYGLLAPALIAALALSLPISLTFYLWFAPALVLSFRVVRT